MCRALYNEIRFKILILRNMNSNNESPSIKRIVKVSMLLEEIRNELDTITRELPDFNADFYDDAEIEKVLNYLAAKHEDEWILIDDRYEQD